MFKTIMHELKNHAPFTFLGATSGILIFFFLRNVPYKISFGLFYTFHPLHVFLSAFVTTSMFKLLNKDAKPLKIFLVGFIGSIGVATLSDSILPFIGETILKLPHRELHLGFIEKWYFVNTLAIIGVILGAKTPATKFPHSAHVFVSTWASLFHVLMAVSGTVSAILYFEILILLFLSVWLPCCFSDIVFPILFSGAKACCRGCCELNTEENKQGEN